MACANLDTRVEQYDFLSKSLTDFEAAIEKAVAPYAEQMGAVADDSRGGEDSGVAVDCGVGSGHERVSGRGALRELGGVESGEPRECGGCSTVGGPRRGTSICNGF